MRTILKFRWLVIAVWLIATVGLIVTAPGMQDLVRTKGQINVPDGYSSTVARELEKTIGENDSSGTSSGMPTVLVFHKDGGLSAEDLAEVKGGINKLKSDGKSIGVLSVTTHFDTKGLAEQMVSKDGNTIIALVNVEAGDREISELRNGLYEAISDVKVEHYYTGNWLISEDVLQSSQDGLKKTEFITLGFILVILFVVFRSAIAPFVPLVAVGFTYLISQSIIAFLVEYFDFPLSNFTQIFLVAVLFGIGTDYCILLISRFKEELNHNGGDTTEAIVNTYRTAGKTVLFSGLAVLVGFSAIGFSTFMLYRSAVAVAVGVAILLIALFTIVPFFMALLGSKLFWPAKGSLEHKPSKLWGAVGKFSLKRPLWALIILAVIIVPFLTAYKGTISFNSLDEIGDKYDSVKAFNIISDSFGPGDSLPTTVIVKTDKPLDTPEGLATLEQVSRELANTQGVKAVRSATRPTGEVMEQFLVSDQVVSLEDGLGQSGEGLGKIGDGLSEASSALNENAPKLNEAVDGAGQLVVGTNKLKDGIVQLGDGLKRIQQGLKDGTVGAGQLSKGLKQAQASAEQLAGASKQLQASYDMLGGGLGTLTGAYTAIASDQAKLASGLSGVEQGLSDLQESYPELQNDANYKQALSTLAQLQVGASSISGQLKQLNEQLAGISSGMTQANVGFLQAVEGQSSLAAGLGKLAAGLSELQKGIAQAATGQGQIVSQLPSVTQGFNELTDGQKELQAGFASLNTQLGGLTTGLDQSVDGLTEVKDGLASAGGYLNGLAGSPNKQMTGWYIPEEAIANEEFQTALDVYMSEDRQTVKFDVVFGSNPYSQETMAQIDGLEAAVNRAIQGSAYSGAQVASGGITSMNNDLSNISKQDYSRTVILMLIGISIILIILFRSIVMPLYMIASLLITFYSSMAIAEVIFVRLLGQSGISWAVPFFGFVMLVALGIDYSIFLMDRFKEYRHLSPQEAILEAMKNMGTVIMSAAVILGGTFAAMLPSGVMSLLQIATIVLCGLFIYALLMLPLFIPVMVRTFGPANWWPFMGRRTNEEQETRARDGHQLKEQHVSHDSMH
ncbi:putative drug exporter of the RND superfamily [Paenibacillus sp. ov031]|uniref:MMPL family transporter n=1 Tax=unclassified Paenibacillus TaxID=185978 RepID=UPI000898564D|nr:MULTISPECIES: MMPL family transporter [unclassified Paenibacillus]SEA66372.1 putative drug exporter of the RND superfamily [Paenibacillus sp. 276b]SHN60186.1 putative drug exporter of the RND superfamily [Paenibacillus sp. ov031]